MTAKRRRTQLSRRARPRPKGSSRKTLAVLPRRRRGGKKLVAPAKTELRPPRSSAAGKDRRSLPGQKSHILPPVKAGSWEYMFRMLSIFRRSHGHCEVPFDGRTGSLGSWLRRQIDEAQDGRLDVGQRQRLENLGVVFDTGDREAGLHPRHAERWERRFAELLEFQKRFGHTHVPAKWKENKPLGQWVHGQRAIRKEGMLSARRMARLDAIGFAWSDPGRLGLTHEQDQQARWELKFEHLRQFKERFGHFRVPREDPEFRSLCQWVKDQRTPGARMASS